MDKKKFFLVKKKFILTIYISGITRTFFARRILSAAGVVGPLAPSAMIYSIHYFIKQEIRFEKFKLTLALIRRAFFEVICCSLAAGTRISHGSQSNSCLSALS